MEPISRLFNCALCHAQVIICSTCDHGNIYCSPNCSDSARQKSCQEADKRYQNTFRGKMNHALRQRRYRARSQEKVTDHGSQPISHGVLLMSVEKRARNAVIIHYGDRLECCCCQKSVPSWVRYGFLQQTARLKPSVLSSCSRPPS